MNKYFKLVSEINYMGGGIFRILLLLVKVECMGGYPLKYFYSLYIYWIEGFFLKTSTCIHFSYPHIVIDLCDYRYNERIE